MLPDERGQGAEIPGGHFPAPMRPGQNLLQREGVYVHNTVLQEMQAQHTDLLVLAAVAGEFSAAREEQEVIGAVPLLDDVQSFANLAVKGFAVKVPAEEDGFDGLAQLGKCLVGRMLDVVAGESPQDGFCVGSAETCRGDVLDHLVVLLAYLHVNGFGQDRQQVRVGVRLSRIRAVELLLTNSLRPPDLGTGQVEGRTSYLLAEMRFGKSSSERTK